VQSSGRALRLELSGGAWLARRLGSTCGRSSHGGPQEDLAYNSRGLAGRVEVATREEWLW
jgi:hypothetical protein